jgi:hypothetical protein
LKIVHLFGKGPSLSRVRFDLLSPGRRIGINEAALVVPDCDAAVCCDRRPLANIMLHLASDESERMRLARLRIHGPRDVRPPDDARIERHEPVYNWSDDWTREDRERCARERVAYHEATTGVTALHIAWWAYGADHVECHGIDGQGGYSDDVAALCDYPPAAGGEYADGIEAMQRLARRLGITVAFVRWP